MKVDLQSKDFPEVLRMQIVLLYKSPSGTSWNASFYEPTINTQGKNLNIKHQISLGEY